jgi:hypothetical protein
MIKKLIFTEGVLETLDYFTEECRRGAEALGIECYVINCSIQGSNSADGLLDFVSGGDCAGFIFNQVGSLLMINGENFWDKYQIPLYDMVVDHPYNYQDVLDNPPAMLRLILLDRDHEKFVRTYYPKVTCTHFLPDGGNEVPGQLSYDQRTIDILYVGSCQQEISMVPKVPYLENNGQEMYFAALDILKNNSFLTVEQAIERYLTQNAGYLSPGQIKEIIITCAGYVDELIRRYYKLQIMHTLESTGAAIEIYGDNWEDSEKGWADNVHIHKRISSHECNRMLGNAKIGLNCMPWFKNGCSERVFNVMLNGAVCLTDVSEYLCERFESGRELIFYELDDMQGLKDSVEWLLSCPKAAEQIAQCGYEAAAANDTWAKRIEQVLRFAEEDMCQKCT